MISTNPKRNFDKVWLFNNVCGPTRKALFTTLIVGEFEVRFSDKTILKNDLFRFTFGSDLIVLQSVIKLINEEIRSLKTIYDRISPY